MVINLRVEDILDDVTNFGSWKTRIIFILEENEIEDYVKIVISEPKDDEEKFKYKKNVA